VLVFLVSSASLRLSALLTVGITGAAALCAWHRLPGPARAAVSYRVSVGARAGLLGTLAYDASRYLVVELGALSIQPFEAIRLFGELLVGPGAPLWLALVVGVAFHACNGIGLAIAFTLLLGGRDWRTGIVYACGLEAVMLAFYPNWLRVEALGEFTTVSLLAHVVYGVTVAETARRRLRVGPDASA